MKKTLKKIIRKLVPTALKNVINENDNGQYIKKEPDKFYRLEKSKLTYAQDLLYTFHSAGFMYDKHFIESYNLGKATDNGHLLKGDDIHWRIHVLCWAAKQAMHLEGDFVDCGVNTGIFARAVINYVGFEKSNKKYYLLDTFNGMDAKYSSALEMERSAIMGYGKNDGLYEAVKETFKGFNVEVIKGSVPETLNLVKTDKICFLSVDMNCVQPEVDALEYFWPKLVSGGIIILDDYGYANMTNDQKAAHDAFAKSKGVEVLTLPTCQGLIIKP